jgi:hypothetical protein
MGVHHWCCKAPISPCWGPGWENSPRCGGPLPTAAAAIAAANKGGMRAAPGWAPWAPGPPNRAKDGGKRGRADNRNFSISASCSRFAFALLFWNQIFTCNRRRCSPGYLSILRGSIRGQVMRDLWWTQWHWGRFSPSTSLSFANCNSTNLSILIYYSIIEAP